MTREEIADKLDKVKETLSSLTRQELEEKYLLLYKQVLFSLELEAYLNDYIELISTELGEVAIIAHNHGWRSLRLEAGDELRSNVEKLDELFYGPRD